MNVELTPATRRAVVAGVIGLPILIATWFWWTTAPQIGGDDAAFDAVDALFTAITSRNVHRVAECEQQLHALKETRRLPRAASDYLDRIIRTARAGNWREAAQTLFGFMKAQRRETI